MDQLIDQMTFDAVTGTLGSRRFEASAFQVQWV